MRGLKLNVSVFDEELIVSLSAVKLLFIFWNSLLTDEQKGVKFSVPDSVLT